MHQETLTTVLLIPGRPVTSIPLLLFGYSARRVPLSMLGFMQYIAPTLQFLLGVYVYNEPFPQSRLVGFSIIWMALLVYTLEGVIFSRKPKSSPTLVDPS
jgi:chloramphenicol-sensitive protein RarD